MKLLFLCAANCARSQVAEGLAKKIFGDTFEVQSAGAQPAGWVHPAALEVLKEIGIDPSDQYSKGWTDLSPQFLAQTDFVVSLAGEPMHPLLARKATRLHWPMRDPTSSSGNHEEVVQNFRFLREELREKLLELRDQIAGGKS